MVGSNKDIIKGVHFQIIFKLETIKPPAKIYTCFNSIFIDIIVAVIGDSRFLSINDLFSFNAIPDTVRHKNTDIYPVEKCFNQTGWYAALENFHKIEKSG